MDLLVQHHQHQVKASLLTIGGRQAYVEEKRPSSSLVGRGRFPSARGGFRNDSASGSRGSYGGGRGYDWGDFNYRADLTNRSGWGGSSNRDGEVGYQSVDHAGNGGGRVNGAGGLSMNPPAKAAALGVLAPA